MTFQPKGDRIQIKVDPEETNIGGFDLQEGDIMKESKGIVIAIGTGVPLNNVHLNITGDLSHEALMKLEVCLELIKQGREIQYKVGDHVLFGKFAGTDTTIDGEKYRIVREQDVFGVLPPAADTGTISVESGAVGVGITGEHDY